jgi:hypothetical protein
MIGRMLATPPALASPCPRERVTYSRAWALCTGEGGAGNMEKRVYRRGAHEWTLLYQRFDYGYPLGIAMARDGFGIIWESRGTLLVTRDGGRRWTPRPDVAQPEVDFGVAGSVRAHGVAFVTLARGGRRRVLETTDFGRTWRRVRR